MIDVFNTTEQSPNVTANAIPTYHWINITGFMKSGKTEFCTNLAQDLRVVHIDLESGTDPYVGSFLKASNYAEFKERATWLHRNIETIRPDVIVIDPLDKLADMIAKDYMVEKNIENLSEMPYGQGWSDTRDRLSSIMYNMFRLAPLVLTITHVKLSILDDARKNITFLDMDLPGKTKAWVQSTADGHALFLREKDEEGNSFLKVTFDHSSPSVISFGGGRIKAFYEIENAEQFLEEIKKKFNAVQT